MMNKLAVSILITYVPLLCAGALVTVIQSKSKFTAVTHESAAGLKVNIACAEGEDEVQVNKHEDNVAYEADLDAESRAIQETLNEDALTPERFKNFEYNLKPDIETSDIVIISVAAILPALFIWLFDR